MIAVLRFIFFSSFVFLFLFLVLLFFVYLGVVKIRGGWLSLKAIQKRSQEYLYQCVYQRSRQPQTQAQAHQIQQGNVKSLLVIIDRQEAIANQWGLKQTVC